MGVTVNSSHVVSAAPSSSGGRLLTLCPCSSVKSLSRAIIFQDPPQCGSFHSVQSFRNRLLQRGSPTGSQALPASLLWHGLLSPQVHRCWQEPAPAQAPHGVTASFRHPPAPAWGLPRAAGGDLLHHEPPWTAGGQPASPWFHRLQVEICSTMNLHGLQGDSLPHHGLQHGLQGKSLCFVIWSTSSPSFATDLRVCRVVSFTWSHSFVLTAILPQVFSPS